MKRPLFLGAMLAIAAAILVSWWSWHEPVAPPPMERAAPAETSPGASPGTAAPAMQVSAPGAEPSALPEGAGIAAAAPSLEEYRKEAHRSPHHMPRSLSVFASRMARAFEAGRQTESTATAFFEELRACVASESAAPTARDLCAVNAGRIAQLYPAALAAKYQALKASLPEDRRDAVELSGY